LQKQKILIVEDDSDLLDIYQYILSDFDVILCKNAYEAMKQIKKERPKIALIDLVLPDIDGIELAKMLKATDPNFDIIAISGFIDNFREKLERIGIRRMIKKPFRKSDIISAIDEILKSRAT